MDTLRRVLLSTAVLVLCTILLPFIVGLKLLEAILVTSSVCANVMASVWR